MPTSQETWKSHELGDFFRIKHGYAFKGQYFSNEGQLIVLTPGNFRTNGGLKLKGKKEKFYVGDFPSDFLLQRDDFLVVMTDLIQNAPILGSPAIIKESGRFLHNQRLGKIVELDETEIDKRFLYYLFNSEQVRNQIKGSATGATVKHTAPDRIYSVQVKVPALPAQQEIASILSAYDDLIENNTRRIRILEEMAQSLYSEWFVHFRFPGHEKVKLVNSTLGKIPEGWDVGTLEDALILQRGFDLPVKQRLTGDVPIYAATGIVGNHNVAKVKGPGVVTGRSGSLGTVKYIETDFWPLNTSLWVKEFRAVTPMYAFYLLKNMDLSSFNSGAAVPTLNRNDVHGLQVILPSRLVLNDFDAHITALFVLKKKLKEKNEILRCTCDLLLPKLISGGYKCQRLQMRS